MKDEGCLLSGVRRWAAGVCLLTSAFCLLAGSAGAAESAFPSRPIRFVVPFPPGTTTDVVARLVSLRAADRLGQPIVIDNRAGASGTIGVETVARGAPDG